MVNGENTATGDRENAMPGDREGRPYISGEVSDVEKIFTMADCAGLLWLLFLGICECCDGGHSRSCVWPACGQYSNGSAKTTANAYSDTNS
jgi:hypothetical protein